MRFYLIICFLFSLSPSVIAFTQEDILGSLEKMGEWQTAYPLALQLAQQKNSYEAWRDVALKYQQFDKDGVAYLQAWQRAYQRGDIESIKNFMSLRPQAELNLHAIHVIYQLTEKVGTTTAYREFVEQFPGAIQSIDALLKMQRLFFEEVKQENTTDAYDAFVVFFPYAEQTPSAIQESYNLEKQAIEQQIRTLDCRKEGEEKRLCETAAKDRIARQLLNEARMAEIEANKPVSENDKESEARKIRFSLVSARKYSVLLNSSLFNDTQVLTEKLDRDERLAFQNQLLKKQDEVKQAIDDMKIAVVAAIKEQTEILGGKLDTLDKSIKSIEQAIIAHHQQMEAQLSKINQSIERGNATLAELQLKQTNTMNGSIWSLASLFVTQSEQIENKLATTDEKAAEVKQLLNELKQTHKPTNFEKIGFKKVFFPILAVTRTVALVCSIIQVGDEVICDLYAPACSVVQVAKLVCRVLPF